MPRPKTQDPRPARSLPHSPLSDLWYRLSRWAIGLMAVLVYRMRWLGRENIPREGGVLVVSNHQSHFDPPLIGAGSRRRMNFLGALDPVRRARAPLADPLL